MPGCPLHNGEVEALGLLAVKSILYHLGTPLLDLPFRGFQGPRGPHGIRDPCVENTLSASIKQIRKPLGSRDTNLREKGGFFGSVAFRWDDWLAE